MSKKKYKIRYKFDYEIGEFNKGDLVDGFKYLSDGLLLGHILEDEEGDSSHVFMSFSGEGKELSYSALFSFFASLAYAPNSLL